VDKRVYIIECWKYNDLTAKLYETCVAVKQKITYVDRILCQLKAFIFVR